MRIHGSLKLYSKFTPSTSKEPQANDRILPGQTRIQWRVDLRRKRRWISRNEMRIIFGEDPDFVNDINNDKHRLPLLWFVENINEVYTEYLEKKISIADKLRLHPYGLREFAFVDINGYYIRIAEAAVWSFSHSFMFPFQKSCCEFFRKCEYKKQQHIKNDGYGCRNKTN